MPKFNDRLRKAICLLASFALVAGVLPAIALAQQPGDELDLSAGNASSSDGSEIVQISMGDWYSAAITADGSLWMWGENNFGQIGDGTRKDHSLPVKVMKGVSQASLSFRHSAAIKSDGSLWMWGENNFGQLGDGTLENHDSPVKVMEGVSQVSLGESYSAAIKTDGSLWMWGINAAGQLGDGTRENRSSPVKVMEGVSRVFLGHYHSAAIKTDGSLWMWGMGGDGELGDGTRENRSSPVKVMEGVSQVSMGGGHSAAITADGSLWMWGYNIYGQLGDGTRENRYSPVKVMEGVSQVSLGYEHSAAIKSDGSLWMWGNNYKGILGDGTDENHDSPVKVMEGVSWVSLGCSQSAAIKPDGSLWMWGENGYGQLGNGKAEDSYSPICIFRDGEWLYGSESAVIDEPIQFPIDYQQDTWPFGNPAEEGITYQVYKDMFGTVNGGIISKFSGDGTGGLCYGMSLTVLASYLGYPNVADYDVGSQYFTKNASCLNEVQKITWNSGIKSSAIDLIKHAHVYQYSLNAKTSNSAEDAFIGLVEAALDFQNNGGEPVKITIYNHRLPKFRYCHEVAVIGVEELSDKWAIQVYDCNLPNEDTYLALFRDSGGFTGEWEERIDHHNGWIVPYEDHSSAKGMHIKYSCVTDDFIDAYRTKVARGEPTQASPDGEEGSILIAIDKGTRGILRYAGEEISIDNIYECESENVLPIDVAAGEGESANGAIFCWLVGGDDSVAFDDLEDECRVSVAGSKAVMTAKAAPNCSVVFDASADSVQIDGDQGDPFSLSFDYYGDDSVKTVEAEGAIEGNVVTASSENETVDVSGATDVAISESTADLTEGAGEPQPVDIGSAQITGVKNKVYTGKSLTQSPVVTLSVEVLAEGVDYKVSYKNNVNAGTATVTVTGKGNYTGTKSATFKISKAKQPMAVKSVTKSVKVKKLKKKAQVVSGVLAVSKAKGTVTYAKVAKGSSKKLTINKKTGKVTVKKGTKKGIYKLKVKVRAKGNANYQAGSKTVTVKIKVK